MKDLYYKVLRHKATIPTTIGVASFAAGYVTCHILTAKKTRARIWNQVMDTLEQVADEADTEDELEVDFTPVTVADTAHDAYNYNQVGLITEPPPQFGEPDPEEIINVFQNNDDDWDMEAELERRTDESPYVLHLEEFINDELGFSQSTLTYYKGDDILTDEKDVPIYDKTNVVGDLRFGYGSGDPNVVYIRCPKLRAEFEVLLDHGSYAFEVLGVDAEQALRHSAHGPLRMRSWDD